MINSRLTAALLGLVLLLGLTACNDDDPTCPGDATPAPTLSNIWPHADGTTWHFDLVYQQVDAPFPEEAKGDTSNTNGMPSLAALHADLQSPPGGSPTISETGIFRLEFDGEVTTDTGITAQNLVASLYFELPDKGKTRTLTAENTSDSLLRAIANTRPDLREAILPFLNPEAKDADDVSLPFLLNGYAFAAEDSGYFGYGDLDTNHSWLYLPSSLEVNTPFSIQLIPAIIDDLWLYGKIWSRGNLSVGGTLYSNVVECLYAIDLGETVITDEEGTVIGDFHSYMYGTIHFAPEVGPIKSLERWYSAPSSFEGGGNPYIRDYVIE